MIGWWIPLAAASPGWEAIGPERGHVVDFSVGEDQLLAATRVGVMKSDGVGSRWERAPEFPPSTRRLSACSKGNWAAPPGQIWEVTDAQSRLVKVFRNISSHIHLPVDPHRLHWKVTQMTCASQRRSCVSVLRMIVHQLASLSLHHQDQCSWNHL